MKILDRIHEVFDTATWRRKQALMFARDRFGDFDCRSAAAVLDCLVDTLGVTFQQLHPDTDLAKDLGADEDEPQWISLWFQDELNVPVSPQQVVDARTIQGLVQLVSRVLNDDVA